MAAVFRPPQGVGFMAAKTNAARILDGWKIPYELRTYEADPDDLSASNVAAKVGMPLEQVFKTLVVRGGGGDVLLACVPADAELDLKALARAAGQKKVELVPLKDILPLTGYVRGGVSPIGTKRRYPVYLDESALSHPRISISAGARGCQLLLAPGDLLRAAGGKPAALAIRVNPPFRNQPVPPRS